MKKLLLLILILAAGYAIYHFGIKKDKGPKVDHSEKPLAVKKHSVSFNLAMDNIVAHYLTAKDAFVEADSAKAKAGIRSFLSAIDSLQMSELDKDTALVVATAKATLADMKSNATSLLAQTDITEMRKDFSMLTEIMYPGFFTALNWEGEKLYFQHCPMAFDNGEVGANWISKESEIVNPYLGKFDPKYKASMLHCGELKDSIMAK